MRIGTSKLTFAVVIAIVSGLGITAYAIGATGSDAGPVSPDGPFLGWEPQGSLSDDAALAAKAERAWDEGDSASDPHSQIRVLFAGRSAEGGYGPSDTPSSDGTIVILQGRDRDGNVSLAYLTDLDWWSGLVRPAGRLRLDAEQPLGDPEGVRAIGSLVRAPGDGQPIAIGLAEPGGSVASFSSPDWHSYSDSESQSGFRLNVLPNSARPERTTFTAKRGGDVIHDALVESNSFPDN